MTEFQFDIERYRLKPNQLTSQLLCGHAKYCMPDIECTCGLEEVMRDELYDDSPQDDDIVQQAVLS